MSSSAALCWFIQPHSSGRMLPQPCLPNINHPGLCLQQQPHLYRITLLSFCFGPPILNPKLPACTFVLCAPPPAPDSWATEQLQRHLATNLSAAPSPPGPAAAPPASAHPLAGSSWPSLALQQPRLLVPAALQCMPWAGVLGVALTQETVITAAGSVTGVACMCEMLAALGACGYRSEVVATVRGLHACVRMWLPHVL